jgi:YbgC/YbaW family acyl-CoA thioester hydrolase
MRRSTSPRRKRPGPGRVISPVALPSPLDQPVSSCRYVRRIQFYETDLAGVVHFSWYLRYMEEAEHALWREAGLSIVPKDHKVGFPRVAASIEYRAPLHFEDVVEVWIEITAITRRSITYKSRITCGDGEVTIARGTFTAVCVDKTARPLKSVDIPADIKARLAVAKP